MILRPRTRTPRLSGAGNFTIVGTKPAHFAMRAKFLSYLLKSLQRKKTQSLEKPRLTNSNGRVEYSLTGSFDSLPAILGSQIRNWLV
jgi:hypothetical protein